MTTNTMNEIEELIEAVGNLKKEYKIPYESFEKPTCKGAEIFGSNCGVCEKCMYVKKNPPPHRLSSEELADLAIDAIPAIKSMYESNLRMKEALESIAAFDVEWAYGLDTNIEKIKTICKQSLSPQDAGSGE